MSATVRISPAGLHFKTGANVSVSAENLNPSQVNTWIKFEQLEGRGPVLNVGGTNTNTNSERVNEVEVPGDAQGYYKYITGKGIVNLDVLMTQFTNTTGGIAGSSAVNTWIALGTNQPLWTKQSVTNGATREFWMRFRDHNTLQEILGANTKVSLYAYQEKSGK